MKRNVSKSKPSVSVRAGGPTGSALTSRVPARGASLRPASVRSTPLPLFEEQQYKSDSAYLSLLLNRRTKFVRVIDYRAGAMASKKLFIQSVAAKEGVRKVITLVEKDEVSSWTKAGFSREGSIPGFYKRSDGYVVGYVFGEGNATVSDQSVRAAEKTITTAKKHAKPVDHAAKGVTIEIADPEVAQEARDQVWGHGLGVGSFDPFGRGAERVYFQVSVKGKANFLSGEYQDCFGHSLIEVLRAPQNEDELRALTAGLHQLCDAYLKERGIVSAFTFAPVEDVTLATLFVSAGFRKTGLLASGAMVQGKPVDAILWTRKLADPDEDAPS